MSRAKGGNTKEKAQSERFIQTARELGADESGEAFEKALGKLMPPKKKKPPNC